MMLDVGDYKDTFETFWNPSPRILRIVIIDLLNLVDLDNLNTIALVK